MSQSASFDTHTCTASRLESCTAPRWRPALAEALQPPVPNAAVHPAPWGRILCRYQHHCEPLVLRALNVSATVKPRGYHCFHIQFYEIIGEGALGHISCTGSGVLPSQQSAEAPLHRVATLDQRLDMWVDTGYIY